MVLDHVAARETAIVGRAVEWANLNSGSRNASGLAHVLALLEAEARRLPAEVVRILTRASTTVADDGTVRTEAHADALKITARPDAPLQVVLTGHYDTVFPAESPFQTVTTRADGALNGPGIADMKGGISVMLAALEAFETHPDRARVGWTVLLSPDEEIGSPASAPLLAELGARGHVGMTYEPALSDGTLAGARKGSGNYHLIVTGKAAHAGRAFHEGANAVAGAAIIAARLHALNGQREGVTVNVAKISG
ncbi:acetylornithine deacetylase, partial [cyanobacterium TDX16]